MLIREGAGSCLVMVTQPLLWLMLESEMLLRLLLIIWMKKLLPLVLMKMKLVTPPLERKQQRLLLSKKLPLRLNSKKQTTTLRLLFPLRRGYQRLTLSRETLLL